MIDNIDKLSLFLDDKSYHEIYTQRLNIKDPIIGINLLIGSCLTRNIKLFKTILNDIGDFAKAPDYLRNHLSLSIENSPQKEAFFEILKEHQFKLLNEKTTNQGEKNFAVQQTMNQNDQSRGLN